ncbi:MAG: YkuS family protein [Firmicutes bacterium]|nr:YkuS family protein [Bacillota bacterium]
MSRYVAVDDKLDSVKAVLEAEGYQVTGLTDNLSDVLAVVVSGMDDDFLGHQAISTEAKVIDASGLDANQVVAEVKKVEELVR